MTSAILLLALAQADPAAWVERLRSDRVEEREEASRKLQELGRKALPALLKAASDPDREIVDRARFLIRLIEIRETLSPGLREALPGIEPRLAGGDESSWTEAFLKVAHEDDQGQWPVQGLAPSDLAPLVVRALRGARDPGERKKVVATAARRRLREAVPELLLRLERPGIPLDEIHALGELGGPGAGEALRKRLRDADPQVRYAAAHALLALRAVEAVGDLRALLRDKDCWAPAVLALADLRAVEAVPDLIALLAETKVSGRSLVVGALGSIGAREALPALAPLLSDADSQVRAAVITALAAIDRAEGVRLLAGHFERTAGSAREQLLGALVHLEADEALPLIPRFLVDGEDYFLTPTWCSSPFLRKKGKEAVDPVLPLLKSQDPRVRGATLLYLAAVGAAEAATAVRPLLGDPDPTVRARAATASGRLGDRESAGRVAALLTEADPDLREAAAEAAGLLRADGAAPALARLLKAEEGSERRAAAEALGRIGGPGAAEAIRPLLKDPDGHVATAAAVGLARLGSRESLPEIVPLLATVDGFDVRRVTEGLRVLDPQGAVPLIERLLRRDPENDRNWIYVKALDRLERKEAVPVLLPLLASPEGGAREYAARALAKLAPKEAVEPLAALLGHADPELRRSAALGLARVRAADRSPAIARLLRDPSASVREAAAEALARLEAREFSKDVEALLLDRERSVRITAAVMLPLLGSRAGMEGLLGDKLWVHQSAHRWFLFRLNALRNPEGWKRLRERVLPEDRPMDSRAVAEWLPREAGRPLVREGSPWSSDATWLEQTRPHDFCRAGSSLAQAIEEILYETSWDLIVESDRLRVVPISEAWAFWTAWWEKERR